MISKKYTFLNVGNQATFLGNIKESVDTSNAGLGYGWTIDNYSSGDDGLLMLHSYGAHGNQNLFYSIKLRNPSSGTSHIHICGQTGLDGSSYDAQPGRFTVETRGLPSGWNGISTMSHLGNYLKTPTTKQVIFVNKQNIHVFWEGEISIYGRGTVYPVWWHFTIGAMDSFFPETETVLNYVDETVWSNYGWISCNFMGGWGYNPIYRSVDINQGPAFPKPITGLLYKQPFDSVPVNKDFFTVDTSLSLRSNPRWYSTIHYRDAFNYIRTDSQGNHDYGAWDYTTWRLGATYTRGLTYNTSFVKHFMNKPVVLLYESLDAENIFQYPIGYLPYQAIYMGPLLKGDDTVSFGTRDFAVYPTLRNGNAYGYAIEYIEG